ncbi:DUF7718 family protein, partial [Klebsiella pneumoniae]|uniref:DUF7718 family protein n=1 Tax=Klebsiella pneumoniae TaxID=573 RepID=UPI003013DE89
SFNYRVFMKGKWIHVVRWDNSHGRCHIDIIGSEVKLADKARGDIKLFEEVSSSIVDQLDYIRYTLSDVIQGENVLKSESKAKGLFGFEANL